MKAVILAGGEGTRLRPLTSNQPKPMIPIVDRPMMEHIVRLLARHGFDDIVVTVAFLADQIRDHFGDGTEFGVRMEYALEETPLGTAGSVGNARHLLDDPFLVIAGDALTDVDLTRVVAAHEAKGAFASIALKRVENPVEFGIVITRDDGSIERFLEKPTWGQVFSDTINTNIYVLDPGIFEFIPEGESVDFSADVFPQVLERGLPLFGHVVDGYWEDVGTLEAYQRAHQDVLDRRVDVEVPGFEVSTGVYVADSADVALDARLETPVVVGEHCRVESGARLGPYTVLGTDVVVRHEADLERAIVGDHAYLGEAVRVRGAVIGRAVNLRYGAHVDENAVIGDESFVGEHAVVHDGVRIYSHKTVEDGANVTASIVWETRAARSLFDRGAVRGLANVDVTPETAVRVAMAYGTTLPKSAIVTTSRDTSRTARAMKRAVIAGLNLTGINVMDLELAPIPLTRFLVRSERAQGGIAVRLAPDDPNRVEILLYDNQGADLDEATQRKLERLLYREDFRRAFAGDIGDIWFPPRAIEYYTAALESTVDGARIRERGLKVVLDYSYGAVSQIMPNVLAKVGAEVLTVNPFASTASATAAVLEHDDRVAQIGDLVRASGSSLGMVFERDGEGATIIDDRGRALTPVQAMLAVTELVCSAVAGAHIAVPVVASRVVEAIAHAHGATVVRTKLSTAHLMEVARSDRFDLAVGAGGEFIWPDFLPAFDATATLVKLLHLLAGEQRRLGDVVDELPQVHLAHEEVRTPWERKGAVMRHLVEETKEEEVVLVDGVQVLRPDGWVLVVPDPGSACTHVWAEGDTADTARRLAAVFVGRVAEAAG